MVKEDTRNIINTPNRELEYGMDKGPLFHIRFLEGDERGVCGGAVASDVRFFLSSVDECITASHIR